MNTQITVSKIRPNPFRNLEHYPIDVDKVEALKASINRTSFWDNLVAREVDGNFEIAYGHHRYIALKSLYSPNKEIGMTVRKLSDEDMLRMMADENMSTWTSCALVEQETVSAGNDRTGRKPGAP